MLRKIVFGKGSRWIALVACWVFITDCTYALKEEDLQKIGFIEVVNSSSEDPAEEDGSENNGEDQQSRRYLDHLILGEADFSFTEALIKKHQASYPNLPKHIIATELQSMETLAQGYPGTFFAHIAALHQLGMRYQGCVGPDSYGYYPNFADEYQKWHDGWYLWNYPGTYRYSVGDGMIVTGVNATRLHEIFPVGRDKTMKYRGWRANRYFHFERIHFNFPMSLDGDDEIQRLMWNFFRSASQIQRVGDRVHLIMPYDFEREYNVINSSRQWYRVIKKHHFKSRSYFDGINDTAEIPERYPGYLHKVNVDAPSVNNDTKISVRDAREYVFERIDEVSDNRRNKPEFGYSEVETDEESSDSSDYLDLEGWYTGDDMNRLMDHYFGRQADERYRNTQDLGLGRMHVINVEALDGDVLRQNLEDRERLMVDAGEAVPQLLVPLNVGEGAGNHWVGLYINRMPDQAGIIQIFYFNSFGNPMPRRLQTILQEIYGSRGVVRFYQNNLRYQGDNCSCGVWVIEFFRAMHKIVSRLPDEYIGGLFGVGFRIAIEQAKLEHHGILHPNT